MINKRPKTIQIFLPSGDPSGIRIAEQTTSIIRLIEVPRSDIADFLKMPEAKQVGLYFLVSGENKDEIYIGQSGEVGTRLMQHNKSEKKDWERALVLVSLTNTLTQTHVLYMESLSIEKARQCERFELINGNSGQRPHTPIPLKADCDEMHEIGSLLLATLGYPIFEPLTDSNGIIAEEVFVCNRSGVQAKGIFTNEGMVVLKGSTAPATTKRKTSEKLMNDKKRLIEKGTIRIENGNVVFLKDHLFGSPSGASAFLLQSSSNGWLDWKTPRGETFQQHQEKIMEGL